MQGKKYTKAQKKRITKSICDKIADGKTIESACRSEGISGRAFRNWRKEYSDFSELFTRACEDRRKLKSSQAISLAESAMVRKLKGYKVKIKEEVPRVVDGKLITITVTKERYVEPSDKLIELVLTNPNYESGDDPTFSKRVAVDHAGSIDTGNLVDLKSLTQEQRKQRQKLLDELAEIDTSTKKQ